MALTEEQRRRGMKTMGGVVAGFYGSGLFHMIPTAIVLAKYTDLDIKAIAWIGVGLMITGAIVGGLVGYKLSGREEAPASLPQFPDSDVVDDPEEEKENVYQAL